MCLQLGFTPKAAKLLIREQGLDNPVLRVLIDKNVRTMSMLTEGSRFQS